MTGILKSIDCPVIRLKVTVDHVHVLHVLSRTRVVSDVVGAMKRRSSGWIVDQPWARGNADFAQFKWQKGYGVFSVSESNRGAVVAYIDDQEEHHRRVTFQDEYREFLKRQKIDFDERYVWE